VLVVPLTSTESTAVHALVGPALGLLLVFRTNSSYDRWWEGRKLWGTIVNTSRNLARAVTVHLADEPERVSRILALVVAWPFSAMHALRGTEHTPEGLDPRDLEVVSGAYHLPTAIARRISALLEERRRDARLPDIVFSSIDANCQTLVDCIGACERIHKTPLPFAYVVHLRRAVVLFCATLPFALLSKFGVVVSLVDTFIVSYIMLGIEEIGVEIEDPFGGDANDLPLKRICASIATNVTSLVHGKKAIP
jgi:ion channel-forming bestrophin family protein